MQLLNIFFLLKDLMNRFFNENKKIFKQGYESVNSVFIAVVTCIICKFLFFLLGLFYSRLPLQFRYLVILILQCMI